MAAAQNRLQVTTVDLLTGLLVCTVKIEIEIGIGMKK